LIGRQEAALRSIAPPSQRPAPRGLPFRSPALRGWFDGGDAARLWQHSAVEAGQRYVEFTGAADTVLATARDSFGAGDWGESLSTRLEQLWHFGR
jgi:alkyl sulfatase-like protein